MKKALLIVSIVFCLWAKAQVPTNGLVAYYGFEGNNNSHNNLYNLTELQPSGPATFTGGKVGFANYFNNNALQTTAISPEITNEFTVAFWQSSAASQTQPYATRFELFGSVFYRNDASVGNQSNAQISISNGSWVGPNMTVQLANNVWQHIAVTYHTNGFFTVWVNGVYDATLSQNVTFANLIKYNQIFSIGGGANGTNGAFMASKAFTGIIDEVYVYNRALNSAEINQVKDNTIGATPIAVASITTISHTVTTNSATINYSLNANNSNTTSVVKYGLSSTALTGQVTGFSASGNTTTPGNATINGLNPSTTYYYQIETTNSSGTSASTIGSFTTNAPNSLTNGLLAFYSFENNNNSYDNVHNLTNSATPNPTYVTGKYGQGVDFGTGGGALTNTSMNSVFNTAEYSIAFWEKRSSNTIPYSTSFELFGSNYFRVFNTGLNTGYKINSNTFWANEYVAYAATYYDTWTHYAFTWSIIGDGTKRMSFYVNGVLVGTSSVGYLTDAMLEKFNSVIAIGNGTNADGSIHVQKAYTGLLDEFYIYNRAITASEVTMLMDNSAGVVLSNNNFMTQNQKVSIYPNPTADNLTIEMDNELKSVEIYSIHGQKVLTSTAKNINVADLAKGIYLVRVEDENNAVTTQKLIVK